MIRTPDRTAAIPAVEPEVEANPIDFAGPHISLLHAVPLKLRRGQLLRGRRELHDLAAHAPLVAVAAQHDLVGKEVLIGARDHVVVLDRVAVVLDVERDCIELLLHEVVHLRVGGGGGGGTGRGQLPAQYSGKEDKLLN